jgi:hypothetical protein
VIIKNKERDMWKIMYFYEVIDTADTHDEAVKLLKEYQRAFKSNALFIA